MLILGLRSICTFKYSYSQNEEISVHSFYFPKTAKSQSIGVQASKNKTLCNLLQPIGKAVAESLRCWNEDDITRCCSGEACTTTIISLYIL